VRIRGRLDDATFHRITDEARDRHRASDLIGRYTNLRRAGNEWKGLCPFRDEKTASFYVNDAEGTYHCFGCGAGGDIIRFVREKHGLTFFETLEFLGAADLPVVLEEERARRVAENEAVRAAAIEEAVAIWYAGCDPVGTDADRYARSRSITMDLPPSVRFVRTPRWRDRKTGEIGPNCPAMALAVTMGDEVVAVQCVFLRDHGRSKAMGKAKQSRGRIIGGAVRFDHGRETADEVIITEGPEDALSLAQELPTARVWATLGTAMMPSVVYPPEIRTIVIAEQNDKAGDLAARTAAAALQDRGYTVKRMRPDAAFKDWNDQLRGIRLDAAPVPQVSDDDDAGAWRIQSGGDRR